MKLSSYTLSCTQVSSKPHEPVFNSPFCALPFLMQPVLPSSGTAEWLLELLEPEAAINFASTHPSSTHDSPNLAASTSTADLDATAPGLRDPVPRAGVLIDTLKHLNPGVKLFRYPDAKKPGCFKERPPYTNWSQVITSAALQSLLVNLTGLQQSFPNHSCCTPHLCCAMHVTYMPLA